MTHIVFLVQSLFCVEIEFRKVLRKKDELKHGLCAENYRNRPFPSFSNLEIIFIDYSVVVFIFSGSILLESREKSKCFSNI